MKNEDSRFVAAELFIFGWVWFVVRYFGGEDDGLSVGRPVGVVIAALGVLPGDWLWFRIAVRVEDIELGEFGAVALPTGDDVLTVGRPGAQ